MKRREEAVKGAAAIVATGQVLAAALEDGWGGGEEFNR
jgi:hypothetical protein